MMVRPLIMLALIAALAACVGPPRGHRSRGQRPVHPQLDTNIRQCTSDLTATGARFSRVPDQDFGGGCSAIGAVQMTAVGPIAVTNTKALKCGAALAFSRWAEGPVQRAANTYFGSRVVRIESMGTYACRNVNGAASGRLSEHASANAIDIGAFVLADGRRVTIRSGWNGEGDEQQFLRAVHDDACNAFITVLSPDYNAAHFDHLHFDMGGRKFCR
jgi:hypothetical protein